MFIRFIEHVLLIGSDYLPFTGVSNTTSVYLKDNTILYTRLWYLGLRAAGGLSHQARRGKEGLLLGSSLINHILLSCRCWRAMLDWACDLSINHS